MMLYSSNTFRRPYFLLGSSEGLYNIAMAIQHIEGGHPGDRNMRNNNPGNLVYGNFAEEHGASGSDGHFAIFPTYDIGLAATEALIQRYADDGNTIRQMINHWAPPSENNTSSYYSMLASMIGVSIDTLVSDVIGGGSSGGEEGSGWAHEGNSSSEFDPNDVNISFNNEPANEGTSAVPLIIGGSLLLALAMHL